MTVITSLVDASFLYILHSYAMLWNVCLRGTDECEFQTATTCDFC
jgi:hypothetical protein